MARPALLILCAIVGAILGFAVSGNGGYQATAILQFTIAGNDSLAVKQAGQTLARTATANEVIQATLTGLLSAQVGLGERASAEWEQDTQLVSVTVTADSPQEAIDEANALASNVVAFSKRSISGQLALARTESNGLLNAQGLDSPAAEAARQAQLGSSLAARQDAIAGQSNAVFVADLATVATTAGLTKSMGAAIGLAVGLLLAGLTSLLLGVRGLRAFSARTLRRLVPDAEISSPSQAVQLAGQFVESGQSCLAVVVTSGSDVQGATLAEHVSAFLRAHGKTVTELGPSELGDRAAVLNQLSREVRDDVSGHLGTDVLTVVVSAGSEASALLEGQSDLRALVVMRRRRTPISPAILAMTAFGPSQPVLVLAR